MPMNISSRIGDGTLLQIFDRRSFGEEPDMEKLKAKEGLS